MSKSYDIHDIREELDQDEITAHYDIKNIKRSKKKSVRKFKDSKYQDDYGYMGWQITKWHTLSPIAVEIGYIKRVNKARSFNATSPSRF